MNLDPRTLAAAFIVLSCMLGTLLLFSWKQNRQFQSLAWWSASFWLIPCGIGIANLRAGAPGSFDVAVANALVTLGYSSLFAGCVSFNNRQPSWFSVVLGPAIWVASFPFIHESLSTRIVLLALIFGVYAACSAWELAKFNSQNMTSQKAAALLLAILSVFNFVRAALCLPMGSLFGINVAPTRWSVEMALLLVVYAPALAFLLLAMTRERLWFSYKESEQALRESEEHYRYSVELNLQVPWTADPTGSVRDISKRWFDFTGITIEDALGRGWTKALHPDDRLKVIRHWSTAVRNRTAAEGEFRLRLADGSYRWFQARANPRLSTDGTVLCWYGTLEDVHDKKIAEERLRLAAYHDHLTSLPNRRHFQECLKRALDQTGNRVGLLILDLDGFKEINDRYGHAAGDELLKAFSLHLPMLTEPNATVARLGGDEFAVVLNNVASENDVVKAANSIVASLQQPLRLSTGTLKASASIGGSISALAGADPDDLLKQADLALYSCKAIERGQFRMFESSMRDEAQNRASALEMARQALMNDWIVPFYQPKVDLASSRITGFEALLRWNHPRLGTQLPGSIANAFDDSELGSAIGTRMLMRVLADMRGWTNLNLDFGRVSINASPADFRRTGYAEQVLQSIQDAELSPRCIGIEVTETVFLDDRACQVRETLSKLRAGGISIALDDFGTGYASLSHLKQFRVDVIKIDKSFVRELESDPEDEAIVKAMLSLGQSLKLRVVAEGVENPVQALFLRQQGCHIGQGYHFGRPMPATEVPLFLAQWKAKVPLSE